jgi:hypothetical protein
MAYQSKSGKSFSNRPMAMQQDKRDAASSQMGKTQNTNGIKNTDPIHGGADADNGADESQEPSAVVAEHGPAEKVMVDHTEGKHKVTSKHPDGHKHTSEHASAGEAHDAARQLSGADDEQASPEASEGPDPMAAMGV